MSVVPGLRYLRVKERRNYGIRNYELGAGTDEGGWRFGDYGTDEIGDYGTDGDYGDYGTDEIMSWN